MNERVISGIQQVGIGVKNADEAFAWYKDVFGFDIQVFAEAAEAKLMTLYTGGQVHSRYAILALNLQGGGGLEIWQYTSRTPQASVEKFFWGKAGINCIKIRCKDVPAFYEEVKKKGVHTFAPPTFNPLSKQHFFLQDPYQNIFEIIDDDYWFTGGESLTGGICGVCIGVTDIEKSISYYSEVLGLSEIFHQAAGAIPDWKGLPLAGNSHGRSILVSQPGAQSGAFGKLLGSYQVELIQANPAIPGHIFKNRIWGDLGYIHLCFDIKGYEAHTQVCKESGYPLTIDSGDFMMGDAGGRFSYNEDPDGTLLEYVETYKVPILKKMGWFLNLRNRPAAKHLPNWMVKALRFSRVK